MLHMAQCLWRWSYTELQDDNRVLMHASGVELLNGAILQFEGFQIRPNKKRNTMSTAAGVTSNFDVVRHVAEPRTVSDFSQQV